MKTNVVFQMKKKRKRKKKKKRRKRKIKAVTLCLETRTRSEGYMAKAFKARCPKPRYRRDTAGVSAAIRSRERAAIRPPRLASRPSQAYDAAKPGLRHSVVCMRAGSVGCALVHPTQFLTQCIVSESLFGTLLMNTVHEHCTQNFSKKKKEINFFKIKSNQIK